MKKQNKKSQGSLITLVLLVMIGIVAVALVGAFIVKMVRDNTQTNNIKVELSLDPAGTFYDTATDPDNSDPSSNQVQVNYVKIDSGGNNDQITGLKLVFYIQGNAFACTVNQIPTLLGSITYKYISQKPDSVEVYPIATISGKEKLLGMIAKTNINAINKNKNIRDPRIVSVESCSSGNLPDENVKV